MHIVPSAAERSKKACYTAPVSLNELLSSHRVIACVGCGGVGKTTTAASLAVSAAMSGRRVLCLTIDPAKRLANSLGLAEMTTEEQSVPAELFAENGLELRGSLSAMMLDTKRTFDDLVTRVNELRADMIGVHKLLMAIRTALVNLGLIKGSA